MERNNQHEPDQLSFLAPDDAQFVQLLRVFMSEASRIYETRRVFTPETGVVIRDPVDAYRFLRPEMGTLDQEQFRVLVLNTKHRLLSAPMIYQGNVASITVRGAEVFRPAIVLNAPSIIVAHNHPSGDAAPSPEDVQITKKLIEAGRLLDIELLDHVIVTDRGYSSLRELGHAFR